MKINNIGNTDLKVSQLGLGTVKFGRNQKINYPIHFDLPTEKEILNLLSLTKELGINLLDTAPAYGTSEERLGKMLKGQRHDWIISTKVGEEFQDGESHYDFQAETVVKSVERSLKRLNTDYLDILLVHSNGDDKKIIEKNNIFVTLENLKNKGLIRAFGMSTKTVEGGLLAIEYSDIAMVMHNPIYTEEKEVIASAYAKNKSIFIKKSFASGHLKKIPSEDPVKKALQFILKEPGVTSIILGTINPEHLRYNVECCEA